MLSRAPERSEQGALTGPTCLFLRTRCPGRRLGPNDRGERSEPLEGDDLAALLGGLPARRLALDEADPPVHDERDHGQDEHDGERVAVGELVGRGDEPLP